jgi:hypothetical protein
MGVAHRVELLQAPARSDEEKQLRQYQKELYDEWVVQDQQLKQLTAEYGTKHKQLLEIQSKSKSSETLSDGSCSIEIGWGTDMTNE